MLPEQARHPFGHGGRGSTGLHLEDLRPRSGSSDEVHLATTYAERLCDGTEGCLGGTSVHGAFGDFHDEHRGDGVTVPPTD